MLVQLMNNKIILLTLPEPTFPPRRQIDSSATEGIPLSCENKRILEYTENTIQLVDGRYRVSTPWKGDRMVLPNNYSMALRRLQSLEKTLEKKT